GSVESLVTHSVTMTHADMDPAEREKVGITDGLVRLSCGLEDADDLIADLDQALGRL
ncbi:MAG: PLP-dependent transferase, partial [Betaproteobacteria bacterium]